MKFGVENSEAITRAIKYGAPVEFAVVPQSGATGPGGISGESRGFHCRDIGSTNFNQPGTTRASRLYAEIGPLFLIYEQEPFLEEAVKKQSCLRLPLN